jgi:molybdopterin adenylyltransferase
MTTTAAVLTVSDKGAAGLRVDQSGPAIVQALAAMGIEVSAQVILPDERTQIATQLRTWAQDELLDLVITTGGTGAAPRDWTPEATRDVIEREMPGLAELLRSEGARKTPLAVLSRGIAGLCGRCLIINLPGSPRAVREGMEILAAVLPHALQMASGKNLEHGLA